MKVVVRKFGDLGLSELYDILQLRSEVFVVEQNCVYQDIDGKDEKALHVIGTKNGKIVAYSRCFPPGEYFKQAAIGRVLVRKSHRRGNLGHEILEASIKAVETHYATTHIKLSAQTYLLEFYRSHGFTPIGEGYLEDGIPHMAMKRD